MGHDRTHIFSGTSDHTFGGLTNNEFIEYNGTSVASGASSVLLTQLVLDPGDITNMATTEVVLVPASLMPGDSTHIVVHSVYSKFSTGGTPYSVGGDSMRIATDNTKNVALATDDNMLTSTTDVFRRWQLNYPIITALDDAGVAPAIVLTADSNPTSGNGYLEVFLTYSYTNFDEDVVI